MSTSNTNNTLKSLIAALPIFLLTTLLFAQTAISSGETKQGTTVKVQVSEKELVRLSSAEVHQRIVHVTSQRGMIIRKEYKKENKTEVSFYLSDVDNPSSEVLLLTAQADAKPSVRLREDVNFVYYRFTEMGRAILGIYKVVTGERLYIKDPAKDIVSASVSPVNGLILYQAREPWQNRKRKETDYPQVFMAEPNGTNARFITNGMGERWSPDGKWFLVKRPERNVDTSSGKRTNWELCIFSADGKFKLELEGFERASTYQWSPTSDHIVLGMYSGKGFQVLALKESDGSLEVVKVHDFTAGDDWRIGLRQPSWSLDGKKISYIKSYSDERGHTYIRNELWIASTDGEKAFKLTETGSYIKAVWSNDGTILIGSLIGETSINEISIENVDQLFK